MRNLFLLFGIAVLCAGPLSGCQKTKPANDEASEVASVLDSVSIPATMPAAFKNVDSLRAELSTVGIGPVRAWKNDGMGFFASTAQYEFGKPGPTEQASNVSIYLESDREEYVQRMKVIVNPFNQDEIKAARRRYADVVTGSLAAAGIATPAGLKDALLKGKAFSAQQNGLTLTNQVHNDRITWYRFIASVD